jgi:NTF2 fold immunity protein
MEISNIVDSEIMAAELAEVYIAHIYGKPAAERQKPYSVREVEGYWQVRGVMQKRQLGGTFEIHIAKEDGKILLLTHSR